MMLKSAGTMLFVCNGYCQREIMDDVKSTYLHFAYSFQVHTENHSSANRKMCLH